MQMQQSLFLGPVSGFFSGRVITAPSLLLRTTCPPSKTMELILGLVLATLPAACMQRMHLTHDAMQMPAGRAHNAWVLLQ
jgi:hypothetical protein